MNGTRLDITRAEDFYCIAEQVQQSRLTSNKIINIVCWLTSTPLAEAIASFGSEAVSLASSVLEGVFKALVSFFSSNAVKWVLRGIATKVGWTIAVIEAQTLRNILDLLEHLGGFWKQVRAVAVTVALLDNLSIVVLVTFLNAQGEPICGSVAFSDGDHYVWKLEDGVYYVLIDGKWVPITDPNWKPGNRLPPC